MADGLGRALTERLLARAKDGARRSDTAAMAAGSVGLDALLAGTPKSDDPAVKAYLEGMNSPFAGMISNMVTGDGKRAKGLMGALGALMGNKTTFGMVGNQTFSMGPAPETAPAPPPATEAQVAAAEAKLGFALPADLRQFYLEVADGGVGLGDGLYSLDELVAKHGEMTSEPVGPQGQDWPSNLLPIQGQDWDLVSIDRESGRLVFWDLEDLDDDEDLPPDSPTWAKSFRDEAGSLEEWLAKWLDAA